MLIRNRQIDILNDTLQIAGRGYYVCGDHRIDLQLRPEEMREAIVYLPDQMDALIDQTDFSDCCTEKECVFSCENIDSYAMARKRVSHSRLPDAGGRSEVLVLNFANPYNPGGGVRRGARAQEEDLCRKSTLLLSLESDAAGKYYQYNLSQRMGLSSDAIILTPKVEIIKGDRGELLDHTMVVSVMTCAAPMLGYGLEGLSEQEYVDLFYSRIVRMLQCAACWGYKSLILGAFGCGAFDNDAALVSDLFRYAFEELDRHSRNGEKMFRTVDFAVLDRSDEQYNFFHFYRNFAGK